ncbi:MAG TPA: hypothetical protein DHU96_13705 [Actinobacteria bacterium]|nr:hypothetical protein [Actinomycetota bacterium]
MFFTTPVFRVAPLTAPARREPLRTDGLYSIVRHPLMLCDIFWLLGLSAIFGSVIGIVLSTYRDFRVRVPRLFPRLRNPDADGPPDPEGFSPGLIGPPQCTRAGHRPRACTPVRPDLHRLLYFPAV